LVSKKYFVVLLFGLLSSNVSAQLHHQMLSSQGSTSYYVRAYVDDCNGLYYGDELSFTTN
jgi:hypothetical protein